MRRFNIIGIIILFALLGAYWPILAEAGSDIYVELTDENYEKEVLAYGGPLMVFFYGDWCPYSGSLIPIYEGIEKEYKDKIKFCRYTLMESYMNFSNPDTLKNWDELKRNYDVDTLPTFIMYNNQEVIDKMQGRPETAIIDSYKTFFRQWIDTNLIDPQENPYRFNGGLFPEQKSVSD